MVNISLVGYGYWGPNVARNIYRNKDFNFISICDLKTERLEMAKQLYANSVSYTENFREIIDNPDIQAVCLAVETSAHFELAKQVINSGKHLYVEKPFTDNVKQAEELKELAKSNGVKIHVDHIMVYHPAIKLIKNIVESGSLGDIIYFDCSRLNLGNVKNDVSSMWDLTVHDLSIIDYITNGAKVKYVRAIGDSIYSKKESLTFVLAQYEGFIASLRANWISPIKERKLILAGTKQMIVYDDVETINKLIVYDKGFDFIDRSDYNNYVVRARVGDAVIPHFEGGGDALYNSLEHFRLCIENNQESLTNADSAIRVIRVLELADEQLMNNRCN